MEDNNCKDDAEIDIDDYIDNGHIAQLLQC